MFFKKKSKKPLQQALELIQQANQIVMAYKRDKTFMPTKSEMELIEQIQLYLQTSCGNVGYIERCMYQRLENKPEGAARFNDDEVMEYHYPSR